MPVIPNRVEANGRPPVPPRRADGTNYRYEMIFDGGNFRGYADTAHELVTYLIPGYDALPDRDARTRARIRFALDLAVRLQGVIMVDMEDDLLQLTPAERDLLGRSRATPPAIGQWTASVPLVLLTTDYMPFTSTPRPRGVAGPDGRQDANILWIDPTDEGTLLNSLADVGAIQFGEAGEVAEVLGAYTPYNPSIGTGIEWTPTTMRLWDRGDVLGEAEHRSADSWDYWYNLRFLESFPHVTHWAGESVWTDRYKIGAPNPELLGRADAVLTGTIQFSRDDTDVLTWKVTRPPADPTALDVVSVPLPELEPDTNLALHLLLAQRVVQVVGGDIKAGEWRTASSVVPRDNLADAFPLQWTDWRLDGADAPPRELFCQSFGLMRPDA